MTKFLSMGAGLLLAAALFGAAGRAAGAEPVVSNVTIAQRSDGSGLVDIIYDLADADGGPLAVGLEISVDGGATWDIHVSDVQGNFGQGVEPGSGKAMVWDAAAAFGEAVVEDLRVRVTASDAGVQPDSHSPANYWIMDWVKVDWSDDAIIERTAKADVAVISLYELWDDPVNETLNVIGRLKAENPDLVVLGYYLAKTNKVFWADNPASSFTRGLYESTLDFWSYTTSGDTLMNWPNQVVLNVLSPACRDSIVGRLAAYQATTANPIDGVMWDYYDNQVWIAPNVASTVSGEPDLNGNGIPMNSDQPELAAYKAACDSLVIRMDEVMGTDFIQVFNGRRAHTDSVFASLGDGMYYEIFPTQIFPEPSMAHALDPAYPFSLFNSRRWSRTTNGGPYTVLGMYWESRYVDHEGQSQDISYGDMYRAIALLTDVYTTWIPNNHRYAWPEVEVNLGPPVGETVIDGTHYWREFLHGRVDVHMKSGNYPYPCSYAITVRDNVVQTLDIPFHYP